MISRQSRFLGVGICASAMMFLGCGGAGEPGSAASQTGRIEASMLGVDTYLYFRCNTTGWDLNQQTRLQRVGDSSSYTLSYDVTAPWMVQGGGGQDTCGLVETNQLDGWGSTQTYYPYSGGVVSVPSGGMLSPGQSGQASFGVVYPSLGRYRVSVDWANKVFGIEPDLPPAGTWLDLVHGGDSSTVHAILQENRPQSGVRTLRLPAVAASISVAADATTLSTQPIANPNGIETLVQVTVPVGTRTLRTTYDVLDGSLAYDGKWYLSLPNVADTTHIRIQLPATAQVERFSGSADSDPEPSVLAFDLNANQEPFAVYTTAVVPDLYDHIETSHYLLSLPIAYRSYQPAVIQFLENLYTRYGQYTGQDINQIQSITRYPYLYLPNHWRWGGWEAYELGVTAIGLSVKGYSTVNARFVPMIALPPTVANNPMIGVTAHELGNGWWGAWESSDAANRTPNWINNEGHSGFLRAESTLDLGYCANAQLEHQNHYQSFLGCTSECGGEIVLLSLRARYGWAPFQAFYAGVQNGTFDLRGLSEEWKAGVIAVFFSEQVHENIAPFLVANHIALPNDVQEDLALRFPTANVPILTQLQCR